MEARRFQPKEIKDASLHKTLKEGSVQIIDDRKQLEDMLAYEGDDICVFMISSGVDEDMNRRIIEQYSTMSKEVKRNAKRIKFVAYDLNLLGPYPALDTSHPQMWLSPGN